MMLRATALGAMLMVSAGQVVAQEQLSGVASVIDGDTLEIHGTRIRLHGIDAPESAQLCERSSGKTWVAASRHRLPCPTGSAARL